ncbi:hypothetical protein O3G_MSEX001240 [Manduca sexta]|uniref:Uncharacterized protein n=1 Tax=Manduca sexta TaxID=7130 RepID=A0A921YJE8_MANSE|nr:hypothetical protein O3G_MSEX001240 [Manduca sexta]
MDTKSTSLCFWSIGVITVLHKSLGFGKYTPGRPYAPKKATADFDWYAGVGYTGFGKQFSPEKNGKETLVLLFKKICLRPGSCEVDEHSTTYFIVFPSHLQKRRLWNNWWSKVDGKRTMDRSIGFDGTFTIECAETHAGVNGKSNWYRQLDRGNDITLYRVTENAPLNYSNTLRQADRCGEELSFIVYRDVKLHHFERFSLRDTS